MYLANEMLQQGLGHVEVGNYTVLQWPNRADITGRSTEHFLGCRTNGSYVLGAARAAIHADRHDRRLIEDNAFSANENERIGRSQVDREIVGEQAAKTFENHYYSVEASVGHQGPVDG